VIGRRAWLAASVLVALASPTLAHKLRVFAAVEGEAIAGHAFFVGGGRPQDVPVTFALPDGAVAHEMRTDAAGAFRWVPPPGAAAYTVTVDAQDGHASSATVAFGGAAPAPGRPAAPVAGAAGTTGLEAAVAAAVQREILPLRQQIDAMDGRLRFTDAVSGVFLILGAAGGALWLRGRRG